MLTRSRPANIKTDLTIKGQNGDNVTFGVTYRNLTGKEFDEAVNIDGKDKERQTYDFANAVLAIVESWDAEYELTREGVTEAESDRAGILIAVIQGFHNARRVELVGN